MNNQDPQNVKGFSPGIGHNGPPRLAPLRSRLEAIMERPELTLPEKYADMCLNIKAKGDGSVEASTADLMRWMSAKDRERVFRATTALQKKGEIGKTSKNGQGGTYTLKMAQIAEELAA